MYVVILAAGQSKRLKKYTEEIPKCLVRVAGKPILERQLDIINLTDTTICCIVAGFKSEKIIEFINNIKNKYHFSIDIAHNEKYATTDNAYSLAIGLKQVNEPVIVLDGDIIFESDLFLKIFNSKFENALLSDYSRVPDEEDCKILDVDGYAVGIGKKVAGRSIYTSMIKLSGKVLSDFKEELIGKRENKEWYSEPLDRICKRNNKSIKVVSTDNYFRTEIDTEEDLMNAEREMTSRCIP